jgi:hypothetical protein
MVLASFKEAANYLNLAILFMKLRLDGGGEQEFSRSDPDLKRKPGFGRALFD